MCEKGTWVCDIRPGHRFSGFFLTKQQSGHRTMLLDSSGSIQLNLGPAAPLESGNLAWVSANPIANQSDAPAISALPVRQWNGNPFAFIDPTLPGREASRHLYDHVEGIADAESRQLVNRFFANASFLRAFMSAPASIKHHHAWPGGLATHTLETLDMASRITTGMKQEDRDLVAAACLLHDVGKAYEYVAGGTRLSRRGRLLGHEITLLEMLSPIADQIWSLGHPNRQMLLHLLTAKPAPQWTGIRHPRTRLVSIVRFADGWSSANSKPITSHRTT